jgi:hypothetical protein
MELPSNYKPFQHWDPKNNTNSSPWNYPSVERGRGERRPP